MYAFLICNILDWAQIQLGLFLISLVVAVFYRSNFRLGHLGWRLGRDQLGIILILLRAWVISLIIVSRSKVKFNKNFESLFLLANIVLLFSLFLTFSSLDYLLFYIIFEVSLIPTLILILGWGYQPERIQAGIYILFYTLFGSLPLLVSLLYLYKISGSLVIGLSVNLGEMRTLSFVWFFCSVFAFVVKLPIYLFHVWLPKAHVEAPVAGSIILAGVLLKLGGYGVIRILPIFKETRNLARWFWVGISVLGGFFVRVICLREIDIKSLIAYSSVAHMGLVLGGLITINSWGLNGAVVVIVGHGLCSSGLFCLANMVYERVGRRSLVINKGLIRLIPSITLWWFLLRIRNMGAPPSINLLGEINIIIRIIRWRKVIILGVSLLSFFCVAYTLYLYSLRQHGVYNRSLYSCTSGRVREFLVLSLHWIPLNILILKRNFIVVV